MKIYLDASIVIAGIEIKHTEQGLIHLIEHYEHILSIASPEQLGDKERNHINKLIENFLIHKQLYETLKSNGQTSNSNSKS